MRIADTENLSLELATDSPADAELLFQLDQDAEVMRYINGGRVTTSAEFESVYLPRLRAYTNPASGWGLWKVTVTTRREFIGWILIRPENFFTDTRNDRRLEIGWRLCRRAWGQGYATEAARAVMSHVESLGNVDAFYALAMRDNAASIRVMQKLGLQFQKHDDVESWTKPGEKIPCTFYERACGKESDR